MTFIFKKVILDFLLSYNFPYYFNLKSDFPPVFSTNFTSPIIICLSTALHIS